MSSAPIEPMGVGAAALGHRLGQVRLRRFDEQMVWLRINAIARKPFAPLRLAPGVAEVSEVVRVIHDGITGLVYGGLHTAIAVAGGAARLAARIAPAGDEDLRPGSAADLAAAALNGFAGDRLARTGNPLAATMGLRHRGRNVALERPAPSVRHRRR